MAPLGAVDRNSEATNAVKARWRQRGVVGLFLVGYFVLAGGPVAAQDLNDLIRTLESTINKAIEESNKQSQPVSESAPTATGETPASPSLATSDEPAVMPVEQTRSESLAPPRDEQTARVQQRLTELGYDPGPVDGVFGPRTKTAIQAFQVQQGIPPDGIASPALLSALEQSAAVVSTPAAAVAAVTAQQEVLIDALEELEWVTFDKIDHDVETIAQAFYHAYEIEKSRKLADFVMLPVVFVKEAFSLYSAATTWRDILASIDKADTVLELSSLVMGLAHLKEAAENFQLAWDGPAYGSLVETMLKEAATAGVAGEYPTIIKLHLAGIGDQSSPIFAQHQEAGTYEVVRGTREIKRKIGAQISILREELSKSQGLSIASIDTIVAKLGEVAAIIKGSKQGNVAAALSTSAPGSASNLHLGSVGALEHVRIQALDQYDRDVRYEQVVAITNIAELGLHYTQLRVGYRSATGELIGEVQREVMTPASMATSAIMKNFETHAREQINGLPYEMVLALSPELTNVWAVLDNALSEIRAVVEQPPANGPQTAATPNALEPAVGPGKIQTQASGADVKNNIRGVRIGMSLDEVKVLHHENCRFQSAPGDFSGAGRYVCDFAWTDVQKERLWVSFTSSFSQQRVWSVEFQFYSPMKCEEAVSAVRSQFGLREPTRSSENLWEWQLNDRLNLQLSSPPGLSCLGLWNWYVLDLHDISLHNQDNALLQEYWQSKIEKKRQSAPATNF